MHGVGAQPPAQTYFPVDKISLAAFFSLRTGLVVFAGAAVALAYHGSCWDVYGAGQSAAGWQTHRSQEGRRCGERSLPLRAADPWAALGLVCLQRGQKEEQAGPCVAAKVIADVT